MGRHTGPAQRGPRTVEGRLEILTFTFDRADPAEGGQRGPEHGAGQGALGLTPRPRLRRPRPAGDAEAPDVWGRPRARLGHPLRRRGVTQRTGWGG